MHVVTALREPQRIYPCRATDIDDARRRRRQRASEQFFRALEFQLEWTKAQPMFFLVPRVIRVDRRGVENFSHEG